MHIGFLINTFQENKNKKALVWNDNIYYYGNLLERYNHWKEKLTENSIAPGAVVVIEADFSPNSISVLLALININCIIVPITESVKRKRRSLLKYRKVKFLLR